MFHYVYRITNISYNMHYYGVRTSSIEPHLDLGKKYFSSSSNKNFIKDQKENAHHYKYKIIRIYNTRKEAIALEIKLHERFNVGVNESFYNKCKQASSGFDITGNKEIARKISLSKIGSTSYWKNKKLPYDVWNKGKVGLQVAWNLGLSREQQPFYGKTVSEEHKESISKANSGDNNYWRNNEMSEEHKRKNSEANKLVKKTEEWNRKNSEKRKGTKLMSKDGITRYIQPEDINCKISDGWVFGRPKN